MTMNVDLNAPEDNFEEPSSNASTTISLANTDIIIHIHNRVYYNLRALIESKTRHHRVR